MDLEAGGHQAFEDRRHPVETGDAWIRDHERAPDAELATGTGELAHATRADPIGGGEVEVAHGRALAQDWLLLRPAR
jgi:hypothetical protein